MVVPAVFRLSFLLIMLGLITNRAESTAPYPPLDKWSPLRDANGDILKVQNIGTNSNNTWLAIFENLIRSKLPDKPQQSLAKGGRYFDKLVCTGMMKSGTTSVGIAMRQLGMRVQGRESRSWQGYPDEWYRYADAWGKHANAIRRMVHTHDGFEDYPWAFLYRDFPKYAEPNARIGYILTIRPTCQKHAESSAMYCNRNQQHQNSREWIQDHCERVYRRCHAHQLDIYNHLSSRGRFDDVLILENTRSRSDANWKKFLDFVYGGGSAVYGGHPVLNANKRQEVFRQRQAFPRSNAHPAWQDKIEYCPSSYFDELQEKPIDGNLLLNLPPHPISTGCRDQSRGSKCQKLLRDLVRYYNGSVPRGLIPSFMGYRRPS